MDGLKRVCVYCASSTKVDSAYYREAETLGRILAENRITTVYGGGSVGLMGALADSVLKNRGQIIGVIPGFMTELEWEHKRLTELIKVKDMHERKKKLILDTDAVIALPGGTGTLEELSEAITMKRLGFYFKPIIIVNSKGFYTPLIKMLERMAEENFLRSEHLKMWTLTDSTQEIMKAIEMSHAWDQDARKFAAI